MKFNPFKAAVGRASVYKNSKAHNHAQNRERLRAALCECANNLIDKSGYKKRRVDEEVHIANIKKLANCVNRKCRDFLAGHFRIGVAQKYFNLKLKKLWCEGKVKTPPHCPFDAIILNNILQLGERWTISDSRKDYENWVKAAKKEASKEGCSNLADWEFDAYNKYIKKARRAR